MSTAAVGRTKPEVLLMEAVVERGNLWLAYQRVVQNKGAPGVDGLTVSRFKDWLKVNWPSIRMALLEGRYMPAAVRAVDIPKPQGGKRTLGIPTLVDRLIEQALLQVLQPRFEPGFSASYVRSEAAGRQAMAKLTSFLEGRLKLRINAAKSAVARPWERKFLGYGLTAQREPKLRIAASSIQRLKSRLREFMRAGRGRSLTHTVEALNPLLRGWINYFKLTETKRVLEELDGWIRRKLRCLLWRQAKRPRTRERMLRQRGLTAARAWQSAVNGRGPWWNAGASHMNTAFPKSFFDCLGLVSLLDLRQRVPCLS